MRNTLILLLLCSNLVLSGATYYIDPSGSNSNNGSSSSPWKTLAYAGTKATASGDIIHVNAGTYIETSQCVLAPGVSIEGEGVTSIIKSHYTSSADGDGLIKLNSTSQNTPGNQSISYLKLDGDNLSGNGAVYIHYRGNVSVHHCTIVDFNYTGIIIEGENSWNSQPVTFSSGNQIYNNVITNCHGGSGGGNIRITGQTACEIHDNIVDGRTRSMQNSVTLSNNKATTIYNNTFYTLNNRGAAFNFVFEIWDTWGGLEIRNNTFIGGGTIDLGGHYTYKGAYAFGASIHNNDFSLPALEVYNASEVIAITVESWTTLNDIYIYSNHIKNFGTGIQVTFGMNSGGTASNFYIYNNIFENVGYSNTEGGSSAVGFVYQAGVDVASWNNINIMNNVIKAGGSNSNIGIRYHVTGATTNLSIKNNIITGFGIRAVNFVSEGGSLSNLQIANNIFYNNGSTVNLGGVSPSSYTSTPNYTSDPLFVSATDYHLQSGSPAIGKGVVISGVTTDYTGSSYKNPPSIGAYESGSVATAPVTPVSPVFQNSVVENTAPSVLQLNYNLALANIIPAVSAFSVSVNSVTILPSAVSVSGSSVKLTLTSVIKYGDIISVSYTKPTDSPLQTASAGLAASLGAQSVTNNIGRIDPVYTSSSIENATPALLEMTYNIPLANIVPGVTSFSVLVNSSARTISAIAVSGSKVRLTLASRIVSGDKVTVSYTKPSSNYLQTSSAGIAASISNITVINNCINSAPVAVLTSPVSNSSFTSPAIINLTASATDADGSVSLVEFYSGNTRIGSAASAPYAFTWNNVAAGSYLLTTVVTDNLNAKTVSPAITISVAERKIANRHPVIRISNPHKGNSYANISTVTIDAIASDPDGTISKVEFYNGSERLVEVTTAPYSYTWKDVVPGSYTVTAIATDNLNDTTMSAPVEFVVAPKIKYDANSEVIKLYPNPNNGHFSVEFLNPLKNDKSEIVITDMAGKQVYNGPVLKEEILKQFDLSDSRSGVYVMLIKDKDILVTKKFIKN